MCGDVFNQQKQPDRTVQVQSQQAEEKRQADLAAGYTEIDRNFAGFNDDFYAGRERAFLDYSTPQLDQQYVDARKRLTFALSDAGTLRSSPGADKLGELERDYSLQKLNLADQARRVATDARTSVANARGNVTRDLVASADTGQAGLAAAQQAQALAAQPTFSPLAQVFQNVGAGVGAVRAANENAEIRDQAAIFRNRPTGSGRVVN